MALSFYVMPMVTVTLKDYDMRTPKYRATVFPDLDYQPMSYGDEPWCLVAIQDVPPATDTALVGNPDVFKLPANLDQTMGSTGTRNTIRNRLESVNMPGTWIQTATTYREVIRYIAAFCQFAQRYQGISLGQWFTGGVTLDTTFGSLPQGAQGDILQTLASFDFDTAALTSTTTMRQIIKAAADQYIANYDIPGLAGTVL